MGHHKRRRPKHLRAGCYCKGWKDERGPKKDRFKPSERRKRDVPLDEDQGEDLVDEG